MVFKTITSINIPSPGGTPSTQKTLCLAVQSECVVDMGVWRDPINFCGLYGVKSCTFGQNDNGNALS